MLNNQTLSPGELNRFPFSWYHIPQFFSIELARELESTFPEQGFQESISPAGHYKLSDRSIVDSGIIENISDLSSCWNELIAAFLKPSYKESIESLFKENLDTAVIKIRLCKYYSNCWMLPHTDRKDRIITQIIYMSADWLEEWGGNLLLLNSNSESDIAKIISPKFNTSVLFKRSENSWHSVEPTKEGISSIRKTILVQFIKS